MNSGSSGHHEIVEFEPGLFGCLVDWMRVQPVPEWLTAAERHHLVQVGNAEVRLRRMVGRYVARWLTAEVSGASPEDLKQVGEPQLIIQACGNSKWVASVAHSDRAMLVVVSADVLPGADIEKIRLRQNASDLAARFFTEGEAVWVREGQVLAGQGEAVFTEIIRFLKIWTRREAVAKTLGIGVIGGFSRFSVPVGEDFRSPVPITVSGQKTGRTVVWLRDIMEIPENFVAALAWRSRRENWVTR